jgi:hypothetical protein
MNNYGGIPILFKVYFLILKIHLPLRTLHFVIKADETVTASFML